MRRWPALLRLRVRSLWRKTQLERELEKELRFHLEQEKEEACRQGLSLQEASVMATKKLGGISQIQEECRDMRRINFVETLGRDARYAARTLLRAPGFTLVLILTLALSIGATSAVFSVTEGVLLRPLPYAEPGRLIRVFTRNRSFPKFPVNPNDFRDFRSRLHSFESLAAYTRNDLQLAGSGEAVKLSGFSVTAGFFHVLGLRPALGREFDRNDELPGRGNLAVISNRLWRTKFEGRRDVLERTILLDSVPFKVIGVMPPGVEHPGSMYHAVAYGDTVDIWTPFTSYGDPNQRGSHYLEVIARLRPGVSALQAQDEMNAAMAQIAREHPDGGSGWRVLVIPLKAEIVGRSERLVWVLFGAVALVLLLACVNAANLLLARSTARHREMAVRAAVGAGRKRLIRQMLTESLLLSAVGAALGAVLAIAGTKGLVAILPADFPRANDIHVDALVFLFTLIIACGTGIAFGIVPALQGSRADLREALHEGGRSETAGQRTLALRNWLVVSEVMLACVLLLGAGLVLRSFLALLRVDPGFRPEQVLTATIALPEANYKDNASVIRFYDLLLDDLRTTAGITSVGAGSDLPWTGWDDNAGFDRIQGETFLPNEPLNARYHSATPDYFRTLGIPLAGGREVAPHDEANSRAVLIINEAATRYWRHGKALGGRVAFTDHPKEQDWLTIVGIVKDLKDTPKDARAVPAFWWPVAQEPFPLARNASIAIRSSLDPKVVADRVRAAVRKLNANLAVSDVRTMDRITLDAYATPRFAVILVSLFAIVAMLLAGIGTYGVIAYSVNRRIHEFGVRMALGARPWDVTGRVLANVMKLALIGTSLGVVLGLALSRLLGKLLYGVAVFDPVAILATCAIALITAACASYVPAMRATRTDPMTALRSD